MQASGVEGLGEPFIPDHLNEDARACVEVIRASMPDSVYCALDSFFGGVRHGVGRAQARGAGNQQTGF